MNRYTDEERPKSAQCYDCGLPYDSPEWIEAVISNHTWEMINPTYHQGAGLLCITCMARRLHEIGMGNVPVKLTAGVFVAIHP